MIYLFPLFDVPIKVVCEVYIGQSSTNSDFHLIVEC